MTLASEDGNRLLSKKPYRDVLQRWRMCLATLFLVVVVLADNFRVSSSCISTTTKAASKSAAFVMAVVITGPTFPSESSSKLTATAQTAPARVDGVHFPPTSTTTHAPPPPLSPATNSSFSSPRAPLPNPPPTPAPLTSVQNHPPATRSMSTPHTPWISNDFLNNYTFNAIARAIKCLQSVPSPENFCFYNSNLTVGETMSSPSNTTPRPNQCLHYMLRRDKVEEVCHHGRAFLAKLRLGFCHRFTLSRVLGDSGLRNLMTADDTQCKRLLNELQDIDEVAQKVYCEFEQILSRYDCLQHYSIRWDCSHCTEAYKAWVCSMMVAFHEGDHYIKPCREVCHRMEQRCPYFLPDAKLQYAGEPTFICIDHDIPETTSMSNISAYGEPPNCYLPCHLDSKNLTVDHCVSPLVVNSSGTSESWGSDSSYYSFFTFTSFSTSSGSLWRYGSNKFVSMYVVLFGLLARTFFSSLPFCLGLT